MLTIRIGHVTCKALDHFVMVLGGKFNRFNWYTPQVERYDYVADDAETVNLLNASDRSRWQSDLSWFRAELKNQLSERR